jgi:hypothetical protein
MRHPVLTACASLALLTCAHMPAAAAGGALHVFSVTALPAGVQTLLREQHGDIADSLVQVSDSCLVEPGITGQRLAAAEVTQQEVRVDIQHGRVHDLTRAMFALDNGQWKHVATTKVPRPTPQARAFMATLDAARGKPRWAPLPTDAADIGRSLTGL